MNNPTPKVGYRYVSKNTGAICVVREELDRLSESFPGPYYVAFFDNDQMGYPFSKDELYQFFSLIPESVGETQFDSDLDELLGKE
jgi:hypothetical protein